MGFAFIFDELTRALARLNNHTEALIYNVMSLDKGGRERYVEKFGPEGTNLSSVLNAIFSYNPFFPKNKPDPVEIPLENSKVTFQHNRVLFNHTDVEELDEDEDEPRMSPQEAYQYVSTVLAHPRARKSGGRLELYDEDGKKVKGELSTNQAYNLRLILEAAKWQHLKIRNEAEIIKKTDPFMNDHLFRYDVEKEAWFDYFEDKKDDPENEDYAEARANLEVLHTRPTDTPAYENGSDVEELFAGIAEAHNKKIDAEWDIPSSGSSSSSSAPPPPQEEEEEPEPAKTKPPANEPDKADDGTVLLLPMPKPDPDEPDTGAKGDAPVPPTDPEEPPPLVLGKPDGDNKGTNPDDTKKPEDENDDIRDLPPPEPSALDAAKGTPELEEKDVKPDNTGEFTEKIDGVTTTYRADHTRRMTKSEYNHGGSQDVLGTVETHFDETGQNKMLEIYKKLKAEHPHEEIKYHPESGKFQQVKRFHPNGKPREDVQYNLGGHRVEGVFYDENGSKKEHVYYYGEPDNQIEVLTTYGMDESLLREDRFRKDGTRESITNFTDNGKIATRHVYNEEDKLLKREEFGKDEQLEYVTHVPGDRKQIDYYKNGQIYESNQYNKQDGKHIQKEIYNKEGELTKVRRLPKGRGGHLKSMFNDDGLVDMPKKEFEAYKAEKEKANRRAELGSIPNNEDSPNNMENNEPA